MTLVIPFIPIGSTMLWTVRIKPRSDNDELVDEVDSVTAQILNANGTVVSGSQITLTVDSDDSMLYRGEFTDTMTGGLSVATDYLIETEVETDVGGNTKVTLTRTPLKARYAVGSCRE